MSRPPGLYQWNTVVGKRFPHLSKPMAACLAFWSLGMILARSCSLTAVAWVWVPLVNEKFNTVRERLRDLYREAPAKAGKRRGELDLSTCWAPWTRPRGISREGSTRTRSRSATRSPAASKSDH